MPITNDRLLRALRGQSIDRTPVWIMRQAGRYLPEYRALRSQVGSFMGLCQSPELAAEVTCQPLKRFNLDAAIIFADILLIPDAMGAGLYFEPNKGPLFKKRCIDEKSIEGLASFESKNALGYVLEAIDRVKSQIEVPLLGFCGSPWTVATYMVEGGSTKDFRAIKRMLYSQPALLHTLLDKLATASAEYLLAQQAAGADALMIFDTWGGVLAPGPYAEFSLAYTQRILNAVRAKAPDTPVIVFTKGAGLPGVAAQASIQPDAIGLDWATNITEARRIAGDNIALQGNIDPSMLYAPPSKIELSVQQTLEGYGKGGRHILNLGHGIHQDIDPAHVQAFIEAAEKHSPFYHS